MFIGDAEEAMRFYVSLFGDGRIDHIEYFGAGEEGEEGKVRKGSFHLAGQDLLCFDSPPVHAFSFTPSISLFVTCDSAAEVDALFGWLSEGGGVLMPLGSYPFSQRFGWVQDRFGVSWQMSLPPG